MNQTELLKVAALLGRGRMVGKFLQGGLKSNPLPNTNPMINRGVQQGVLPTWSQGKQAVGQMGRMATGTNALDRQGLAGAIKGYRKDIRPKVLGMNAGQLNAARPGAPMPSPTGKPAGPAAPSGGSMQNTAGQQG